MRIYESTRSTKKPENITIDEYNVWACKNIKEIEIKIDDEIHTEYEFTMVQYSKNEYIKVLHEQITNTELALTEIYEEVLGNG